MTKRTKMMILLEILHEAGIANEKGHVMLDFENQGRDCLDFASVSRDTLYQLINDAFEAGRDFKEDID